ncbi:hypothetical protein C1645_857296 [Glomus cerebriforme]|uniref:ATPase AAA-type core domain-containing protein n=1 Tax=Glomus cerebriforme TaxID=658196 RepID=A0A397SHV5_9GLOM|nr:hypothetical protein C1645_857296 [Glomus cerebriforme]
MAIILLRVRANIPAVICGKTGCGKITLIKYLALIAEVQFQILNLYAKIDEKIRINFVSDALKKAEEGEIWMLFDDINIFNHLGLLAETKETNEIQQNMFLKNEFL